MPHIHANNANFYYETYGSGQPIILIAGYTLNHSFWMPIFEQLKNHFQVLVFDNRGTGETKDDAKNLTAELMANDVIALAEALQLHKPHIVGHSMGGTIAQTIAYHYPDKISKAAFLSTSSKWRQATLRGLQTLITLQQINASFDVQFEALLPWIFGEKFLNNPSQVAALKQSILNDPHPTTLENQLRQFEVLKNFNSQNFLKSIQVPVLIGHGIEDLLSLPDESRFMADQIKHAKLVTYNCGHDLPHEITNELVQTLIDFLK